MTESFKTAVERATEQAEAIRTKTNVAKKAVISEKITQKLESKMKDNPIDAIVFNPDKKVSLDDKVDQIAKVITIDADASVEENMAKIEALNVFKEFLQMQLKDQAVNVINTSADGVFGRLTTVIDTMNGGLAEFDKTSLPLVRKLEAVNLLRTAGVMEAAYKEIKEYDAKEDLRLENLAKKQAELEAVMASVDAANQKIADLTAQNTEMETGREYKGGLFGLGGVKKEFKAQIADNRNVITTTQTVTLPGLAGQISALTAQIEELKIVTPETTALTPEQAAAKAIVREMMNTPVEEQRLQQEALINCARNYVEVSDANTVSIAEDLGTLKDQLTIVNKNVVGTDKIYSLLQRAIVKADDATKISAKQFEAPVLEDGQVEDPTAKVLREEKKAMFDAAIKAMYFSNNDTINASAELANTKLTVQNMADKTETAISTVRTLKSGAITQVATGAATAITAINNTAVKEAASVTEDALTAMRKKTHAILANEVISTANYGSEIEAKMKAQFEVLSEIGNLVSAAKVIEQSKTGSVLEIREDLKALGEKVKEQLGEYNGTIAQTATEFNSSAERVARNDNTAAPVIKGPVRDMNSI